MGQISRRKHNRTVLRDGEAEPEYRYPIPESELQEVPDAHALMEA